MARAAASAAGYAARARRSPVGRRGPGLGPRAWRAWARLSSAQAACSGQQPPPSTLRFLQPGLRHGRGGRCGIYPHPSFCTKENLAPHAVCGPSLPKIQPAPGALSRGQSPHRTYLPDGSGKRRGNREFFVRRCREDGAGEAMHADRVPPAPRQRSRSARLSCSVPRPAPAMCSMTSLLASTNRSPGGRWISPRYGNGVSYLREAPGGVGGDAVRALARICRTRRGVTPASGAISWVETP